MLGDTHLFRRLLAPSAIVLLTILAILMTATSGVRAQGSRSFVWDKYDVTIQVEEGGSLLVTERFDVAFSGEPAFTYGYADIPLDRMEALDVISVAEVTDAGTETFQEVPIAEYGRKPEHYYVIGGHI